MLSGAEQGIAVAGTATSLAAVDQELEPYDPARVHGYQLELGACERMLAMLAALPLHARRDVPGLHPDRAPTILAGVAILVAIHAPFRPPTGRHQRGRHPSRRRNRRPLRQVRPRGDPG